MSSVNLRRWRARSKSDRGAVSLEILGTMIFVVMMVLFAWQGLLAMHALSQANTAARDAARAESIALNTGESAGIAALSQSLQSGSSISCSPGAASVRCTADVNVPVLSIGWAGDAISPVSISRSATMPRGSD